jgi:hypothetical protein
MIYVGIDDTDVRDSPGTNKLARHLIQRLAADYESLLAVRHQLLFDPRIPYTSKNSSASLLFRPLSGGSVEDLAGRIRGLMREWFVAGSDPGLCVTAAVPEAVTRFALRCQADVVAQEDARRLAAAHRMYLEGLGGTEDGVIGALAAVGLLAGGDDGRVVNVGQWPDDLSGPVELAVLHARGVEARCVETGERIDSPTRDPRRSPVHSERIDVGKHLRPNYRGRAIVLFVTSNLDDAPGAAPWRAVRLT